MKLFCYHSSLSLCEYCYYVYCHDIEAYLLTEKKCFKHDTNLVHHYGDDTLFCLKGKEIFRK